MFLSIARTWFCWIMCLVATCCLSTRVNAHVVETSSLLLGSTAGTASTGTGLGLVTLDLDEIKMTVHVDFSGLQGTITSATLNGATTDPLVGNAPVMTTMVNFPVNVVSGAYDFTYDLTIAAGYDASFVSAQGTVSDALNALVFAVENQKAYLVLNTTAFPGGELKGFLLEIAAVPEPASLACFGLTTIGLTAWRRRHVAHRRDLARRGHVAQ